MKLPLVIMLLGTTVALSCFVIRSTIDHRSDAVSQELSAELDQLKSRIDDAKAHGETRGLSKSVKPQIESLRERVDALHETRRESAHTTRMLNAGTIAGLLISCFANLVHLFQRSKISR